MRLWVSLCCALLMVGGGCAGPHSTGGLWAQQNLEQEAALFRLSDAQRAEQARAVDLGVADQALSTERIRLESDLAGCPGVRQPLGMSKGDRPRDGIRIRVSGDSARVA